MEHNEIDNYAIGPIGKYRGGNTWLDVKEEVTSAISNSTAIHNKYNLTIHTIGLIMYGTFIFYYEIYLQFHRMTQPCRANTFKYRIWHDTVYNKQSRLGVHISSEVAQYTNNISLYCLIKLYNWLCTLSRAEQFALRPTDVLCRGLWQLFSIAVKLQWVMVANLPQNSVPTVCFYTWINTHSDRGVKQISLKLHVTWLSYSKYGSGELKLLL